MVCLGAQCWGPFSSFSTPHLSLTSLLAILLWQLQKSAPLSEIDNLIQEIHACAADIKAWMTENQLKLNDDKTEALLLSFFSSSKPAAISLHNIPFSDSVRNLGFILDSELSMKKHAIKICQTAYFELNRISSIRRFLTEDATKTLVTTYVLSRIHFCNCLSIDAPNSVIEPLQKVKKL